MRPNANGNTRSDAHTGTPLATEAGADALTTTQLPDAFESWRRFWDEVGVDPLKG